MLLCNDLGVEVLAWQVCYRCSFVTLHSHYPFFRRCWRCNNTIPWWLLWCGLEPEKAIHVTDLSDLSTTCVCNGDLVTMTRSFEAVRPPELLDMPLEPHVNSSSTWKYLKYHSSWQVRNKIALVDTLFWKVHIHLSACALVWTCCSTILLQVALHCGSTIDLFCIWPVWLTESRKDSRMKRMFTLGDSVIS